MDRTDDDPSKKRKILHDLPEDNDGEESEDQKMEKFFSLIKSIRDARDRLTKNGFAVESKEAKSENNCKASAVWKPAFVKEDFIAPDDGTNCLPAANLAEGGCSGKGDLVNKVEIDDLDLRLSL